MSWWLVATIGVVYLIVAVDLYVTSRVGLAIAFLGYAIGNVGLVVDILRKVQP